jgi:hypothetical protein
MWLRSNVGMRTPEIFLAYAPRGAGLRCAVAYLADKRDVYGWFTGPREDSTVAACYFVLRQFYAATHPRYEAVASEELHVAWSLDEDRRHELARLQERFAREWLFYRAEAGAAVELHAYARAELATGEVNVRFGRLAKFSTAQPNWTYYSPHFEHPVLRHLARHWPLEYRLDGERVAAARKARIATRARP